ncbi:hypothetical protein [Salinibacter ruber]|uniref:hypothetical protein n=1 Tax=Salinibacter ruber TaxID=146919 RepID=UPI002166FBA5|nr:hypothetical protein [Salinibacter ruber]MCS3698103.1 hypothetical protein [Salinibacter ruber]
MSQLQSYNLPGYGLVEYQLYPHAKEVWDLLSRKGHIQRFKKTDHLGSLREIFPGAHHTRYEYVIAQLALVTELCSMTGHQEQGFQMSSKFYDFGVIETLDDPPSRGELLQTLILATNLGHLPSTFAGERAFLRYIAQDSDARYSFRNGLPNEDKEGLDDVIRNFSIYRIHYYISIFLLHRYRKAEGNKEVSKFAKKVLRGYVNRSEEDTQKLRVTWRLHESIRRFVYLSLDTLYTHIPFSIDLSNVFLSFERYRDEVLASNSVFQNALKRLEGVMRDAVYLSPRALLQLSSTSKATLQNLGEQDEQRKITLMQAVLGPRKQKDEIEENIFEDALNRSESYEDVDRVVSLAYDFDPSTDRAPLQDTVEEEKRLTEKVGKTLSSFGVEWDPSGSSLRIAASIDKKKGEHRTALNIVKELYKVGDSLRNAADMPESALYENRRSLNELAYQALWGWDYNYRFIKEDMDGAYPLWIKMGTNKIADDVVEYRKKLEPVEGISSDEINEYTTTEGVLRSLDYKGHTSVYAGSLEVTSQQSQVAEFDSVILFLGDDTEGRSCIVVEAKNTHGAATEAKNDLEEKAEALGMDDSSYDIVECEGGACLQMYK